MQICKNCGAELLPDSSFCEQCGAPVPKTRQCPNCGAEVSLKAKFCSNCGSSMDGMGKTGSGTMSIGDKNVIAGDVIGSKEETKVYGSATIIRNDDQTKKIRKCHVCGSLIPVTHGFECPDCGEFTCEDCYDSDSGVCKSCAGQRKEGREAQYKRAFQEAMADGRIEFGERRELFVLQKSLGLDSETVRRLEEEQRREESEEVELSIFEKKVLAESKSLLYEDGNPDKVCSSLEPLLKKHPFSEEILDLYIPALSMFDREKAMETIDKLTVDLLIAYVTLSEILIKENRFDEAERTLKKASRIWNGNVLVDCHRALYYYALFKRFGDSSFLRQAKDIADNIGEAQTELELSWSIKINDVIGDVTGKNSVNYDKKYCSKNNLYWTVMNNNIFEQSVCIVGNTPDCDFSSIREAINCVKDGGTIVLKAGLYVEDIEFSKCFNLKGCESDISGKSSGDLPIVVFGEKKTCLVDKTVKIEGIVFTNDNTLQFKNLKKYSEQPREGKSTSFPDYGDEGFLSLMLITSDAEISNCAFLDSAMTGLTFASGAGVLTNSYMSRCLGPGLSIVGNASTKVDNCVISSNVCRGIDIQGNSSPILQQCDVSFNKWEGITVWANGAPIVKNCKIHDNKTTGVQNSGVVCKERAKPVIEGCEIYNHLAYGIWIKDSAAGTYRNCNIHENEKTGLYVQDTATPDVEGLEIFKNKWSGIIIEGESAGNYKNCIIHENDGGGIVIVGRATPKVESLESFNNKGNGINVSGDAAGSYKNCKIHDNKTTGEKYPGVVCMERSKPVFEGCEIYNHLSNGIWIKDSAAGTYRNCRIHDNVSTGIAVTDKAAPDVEVLEIFNNKGNGINVSGDAAGSYKNCKIHDNKTTREKYPGVVCMERSKPVFEGCEIYNHLSSYGIWIKDSAAGIYRNCRIHDNTKNKISNESNANPTIIGC